MAGESVILEVRADEVRVGDDCLYDLDGLVPNFQCVGEVDRLPSGWRILRWQGGGAMPCSPNGTVIVRRPVSSTSETAGGAEAIRRARAVLVDYGAHQHADDLREYCAWAWDATPPAGEPTPSNSKSEQTLGDSERVTAVEYLRRRGVTLAEGEPIDDAFRRLGEANAEARAFYPPRSLDGVPAVEGEEQ